MKTLVMIPAYNEEGSIVQLVEEIKSYEYDYIVINDLSKDSTPLLLDENRLNHLDLPINLGLAGVTRVGYKYAYEFNYDCVICIDGDGQHQPCYIDKIVKEVENGYDYVVGSRFVEKEKDKSMRMLGSRILCWFIQLKTGVTVTDPTSGMRAAGRKVIEDFNEQMNYYAEPDALCHLIKKGYKTKEVQVEMKERETGVSYFRNPFKSAYFMMCNILSILLIQ